MMLSSVESACSRQQQETTEDTESPGPSGSGRCSAGTSPLLRVLRVLRGDSLGVPGNLPTPPTLCYDSAHKEGRADDRPYPRLRSARRRGGYLLP